MNTVSQYGDFKDIWYELKSLLNNLLLNLTNSPGQLDIWRYAAAANIIAHILTTMEKIDNLPSIPERTHPEYEEKFRITFNTISLSAKVYISALGTLYTISQSEFLHWTDMGFWHLHLLNKLFELNHIPTLAKVFSNNIQDFYRWFYFNIQARCSAFVLSFTLLNTYTLEKLQNIQTYNVVTAITAPAIAENIDTTLTFINEFLSYINNQYKAGIINVNDNPNNSPWITNIQEIGLYLKFFQEYGLFIENELFKREVIAQTGLIDIFLEKMFFNINYIKKWLPSGEQDPLFIHLMKLSMAMVGYKAQFTHNQEEFSSELKKIQLLKDKFDIKEFPEIYFFEELTKVWVYCELGLKENIIGVTENLVTIRSNLRHRPRDYITTSFLLAIITFISEKEGSQTLVFNYLNDIMPLGSEDANMVHLKEKFNWYWQTLKDLFTGGNPELLDIPYKTGINVFDPLTWVIPNFSKFFKLKNKNICIYIHFNRNIDGIVQ